MEYLPRVPEVKDTVDKQSLLSHLCAYVVDRFVDSTDLFSEIPAISRAAKVTQLYSPVALAVPISNIASIEWYVRE